MFSPEASRGRLQSPTNASSNERHIPEHHSHVDRQASLDIHWEASLQGINTLVKQHEDSKGDSDYTGITRQHWQHSTNTEKCMNKKCNKKFSLFERSHHCRRCGKLFCKPCTAYQRRLNNLAHPDPNGKLYKVCQYCYDQGPQTQGFARNWTKHFNEMRNQVGDSKKNLGAGFEFDAECSRLKSGFEKAMQGSSVKKILKDMSNPLSIPDWQKPKNYVRGKMAETCHICGKGFGFFLTKHICKVCGVAACSPCSSKDLIVFIDDKQELSNLKMARLAIIKIVGCPDKEPDLCLYLRLCNNCYCSLEEEQVQDFKHSKLGVNSYDELWNDMKRIHEKLKGIQSKIDTQLPKYQELIELLEISSGSPKNLSNNRSNTQTLAKAQGDLSDHFTQLVMTIHNLKQHKPATKSQAIILRNIIKSQFAFYQENMCVFRELKRTLETTTPAEVLNSIQEIVDRNAINSCYLYLKQLAFEALYLCEKHKLVDSLTQKLIKVEGIVQEDLKASLSLVREDWTEHESYINKLLQMQLKDHRLVRISKNAVEKYGSKHVEDSLQERTIYILKKLKVQLNSKCADRSFKNTKQALKELHDSLECSQGCQEDAGWLLV